MGTGFNERPLRANHMKTMKPARLVRLKRREWLVVLGLVLVGLLPILFSTFFVFWDYDWLWLSGVGSLVAGLGVFAWLFATRRRPGLQ